MSKMDTFDAKVANTIREIADGDHISFEDSIDPEFDDIWYAVKGSRPALIKSLDRLLAAGEIDFDGCVYA